ncbi:MAG: hypothetical protein NDI69_07200 [Bacteriovoracaceae bacterium]|nr:hypothetical protein [Bacteriovoracaceae bacterium]
MSSILALIFSLTLLMACGQHDQVSFGSQGVKDTYQVTNPDELSQNIMDEDLVSIEKFLKAGGTPEFEFSSGRTLLTEACFWSKISVIEYLIKHKADVHFKDRNGQSGEDYGEADIKIKRAIFPELVIELKRNLFFQAKNNFILDLKKTLEEKPPVNFYILASELGVDTETFEGETFLTFCVKQKLENVLRLLAQPKYGLDVNLKNKLGESPLQIAKELKLKNIEKLLMKLGAIE